MTRPLERELLDAIYAARDTAKAVGANPNNSAVKATDQAALERVIGLVVRLEIDADDTPQS